MDQIDDPTCICCGGSGMHGHKPFINASPYDVDAECTACAGTGKTRNHSGLNNCTGYHQMMRSFS